MITSKLTSKSQTTIPLSVRTALGLKEGDQIGYVIENGRAILSRVSPAALTDDPFVLFDEWDTEADRRAYRDL